MLEITDKTSSFELLSGQNAAILASIPALLKSEGAFLRNLLLVSIYLAKMYLGNQWRLIRPS
jgi:hypothetical protein